MNNYCYNCMEEMNNMGHCDKCKGANTAEVLPHHLSPGQVLHGKYLVGNSIGEGGFGITYIGRDLVLDIKVAIKEFFPNGCVNRNNAVTQDVTASTSEQKEVFAKGKIRFLEEAKNIAKFIDEPGVVGVREFFEANGTAYIIMDYLDGTNLSKYIRQNGAMPADKVFRLMLPVMKSLEHIHNAGIIHRDISPDNIMYLKNGTLKLMDFGSARYFTNEEKEMSVMLKQGYAPEEQYRKNGHQGPWTDVYGLCATIYRCITGVVPLDALDRLHEDKLRKPSQMGVAISPALEAVLMYGLAVRSDRRYKDMGELSKNVEKVLQNSKAVAVANPPHSFDDPRINKTRSGDKTVFADEKTYGDGYVDKKQDDYPKVDYPKVTNNKPKSNNGMVGLIVFLIFLLVVAVGVCLYLYLNNNSDNDKNTEETKAQAVTVTEAPTQALTEAPTEVPKEEMVSVPNVEDLKYTTAEEEIKSQGLKVKTVWTDSSYVDYGYVVSQSPESSNEVSKKSTVTIYVSQTQQIDSSRKLYSRASDTLTLRETPSRSAKKLYTIKTREPMEYISTTGEWTYVEYKDKKGYVLSDYVSYDPNAPLNYGTGNEDENKKSQVADTSTSSSDIYYCRATEYVTLRASASINSAELDRVLKDETVEYISTSGAFFKVRYCGQTGYVLKKFFSKDPNAPLLDDPV